MSVLGDLQERDLLLPSMALRCEEIERVTIMGKGKKIFLMNGLQG